MSIENLKNDILVVFSYKQTKFSRVNYNLDYKCMSVISIYIQTNLRETVKFKWKQKNESERVNIRMTCVFQQISLYFRHPQIICLHSKNLPVKDTNLQVNWKLTKKTILPDFSRIFETLTI